MKEIYEREVEKEIDGETEKVVEEVKDKKEATHKHICHHDEKDALGQSKPCKRVKL